MTQSETTTTDGVEYVDRRGIRVADTHWTCPNCGIDGELMYRPGSKDTCATCFWVIDGQNNDYVLPDWPLKYRQAQRLLAGNGLSWGGTPGNVGTELRKLYDSPEEAAAELRELDATR